MLASAGLRRVLKGALLAMAAIAGSSAALPACAQELTGAGATFPAPIYTKWGEDYARAGGDKLNYQALGSGAGVTQVINRTVDFGTSDAPVKPDRLTKENLLQFPAVIGAVVVVVNVPGVDGDKLKLTGPLIADIYLGRIRMWNDTAIATLNPGIRLPDAPIAPAYRADSSGTTNIFTNYLALVSPEFKTRIGAANAVPWRTGIGAPGNAGVAAAVKNTKGGIGYVEFAYATENGMKMPSLQNQSGVFLRASEPAFVAAADQADWANAPNMAASMLNLPGQTAWPIVSATYILVPKNPANATRATRVLTFFDWAYTNGAPAAERLHYTPLPASVQEQARKRWSEIRVNGQPVWPAGASG